MPSRQRLVRALLLPHGVSLAATPVAALPHPYRLLRQTVSSLVERAALRRPQALFLLDPHGVRVSGHISVGDTESLRGTLPDAPGRPVAVPTDRDLVEAILREAQASAIPVASVGFGSSSGEASVLPLSWGAVVPLTFVMTTVGPLPTVIMTPPKDLSSEACVAFGRALRRAARDAAGDVLMIASGDLSHTHDPSGPYGFHPSATRFDDWVLSVLETGDLSPLEDVDPVLVEEAKPDALRQLLILKGYLEGQRPVPTEITYARPSYFGMAAAGFAY